MPDGASVYIEALLREREGYERAKKEDRVAQVDEQLANLGYRPTVETAAAEPPPVPAKPEPETASIEATETAAVRTARPKRSVPNG